MPIKALKEQSTQLKEAPLWHQEQQPRRIDVL